MINNQGVGKIRQISTDKTDVEKPLDSRSIEAKLSDAKRDLPMEDAYDERRRPRSKRYLATIRALRTQYAILAEYEAMLLEPVSDWNEWGNELVDPQIRAIKIQKEIELVTTEIKQLEDKLTQLMPKGDGLICRLYMDSNIGTLMSRGIISSVGTSYHSEEELCEFAYTEEERKALIFGDIKLHSQPTPLVIEVYLHLVIRVHADGSIETFDL